MRSAPFDRALVAFIVLGGAALVWSALVEAPSFAGRQGFTAPLSWKLFFFHVPVAFASFVAFGLASLQSLLYLVRPTPGRDQAAQSAVEAGVLLSATTLATGMVWGKAEWGTPWRWDDAKLVLVLLMFTLYVAYLVLRREIDDPEKRGRIAAVYAMASFVTVPLAWFAQRIWLSFHPVVFGAERSDTGVVTPDVLPIFLLGFALFLALLAHFYRWRRRILALAARIDDLETVEAVHT